METTDTTAAPVEGTVQAWGDNASGQIGDGADASPSSPSVLDGLRAMRDAKAAEDPSTLTLDVPGYAGRLAMIFRYPETGYKAILGTWERHTGARNSDPDGRLYARQDVILGALASLVYRDEQEVERDLRTDAVLTKGEVPPEPVLFDKWLADKLGIEVPEDVKTGRYVMRMIFSPQAERTGVFTGDLAIIGIGNQVFGWLTDSDLKLEDDMAGE